MEKVRKILKDCNYGKPLERNPLATDLASDIKEVRLPSLLKVKEEATQKKLELQLQESSPESNLRHQDLSHLVKECKNDKIRNDFKNFLERRSFLEEDRRLKGAYQSTSNHPDEESFVQKARIVGVVLRTSSSYVSLLTLDGSEELLVKVDRRFVGLGIEIGTGDVIDVLNPKLTSSRDLDPKLRCCYAVNSPEIITYLENLLEQDDPCTILEDFLRSRAVWKYILNKSVAIKENELLQQGKTCMKILQVCQIVSIPTPIPMAATIRNFWTSFEGSIFFNHILLNVVKNEAWQEQNVDLVTNFLENLLSHLPKCGITAIEIVDNLNIQSGGMEFMKKLLSILARNVDGVKDNPEHLKWNQQSIIPVSSELRTTAFTHWKDLPSIKVTTEKDTCANAYKSEEEYIMTYYTLLREECFHTLKKGINHFLRTGMFDPKDIMMYRVSLVKVGPNVKQSIQEGLSLALEFNHKKSNKSDDPEDAANDPDNSTWLMFGNLVCLSFDATFQFPVWGIIIGDAEDVTDSRTCVPVSLCPERNKLSDAEVFTKMQKLQVQGFLAYMVESNTFYSAFGPPLEVLQQKETVPFKEQLVEVKKCTDQPPEYLKNINKRPDWRIIFRNLDCIDLNESGDYTYEILIKEFKELREKTESEPILDDKQLDAVEQALRNKVTLIQGPPGTGKSYVGETLLQLLLSMDVPDDNGPILVVTYKNHALDNFLETFLEKNTYFQEQLVRVGRGGDDVSEELRQCNILEINKKSPVTGNYKTSQELYHQIEAMKPKIDKCVKSLQCHSIFTVSVFIKEAEDEHLETLSTEPEYVKKLNKIMKYKHFKEKHFKELCKMIEEPLKTWLPSQKLFDRFAGKVREKGLQSLVKDMDYGTDKQGSNEKYVDDSRQSLPSDEKSERLADADVEEEVKDGSTDSSLQKGSSALRKEPLRVLPEIPDKKLGNVKAILNAGNIQDLKDKERIQMVYALQRQRYKTATNKFLSNIIKKFTKMQQRRKELRDQLHIKVLKSCKVIGMTVSGAAIRASLLGSVKPSVIIVEQAAEILESQLVAVIPSSVQHLIMIGDHQQLRPQVHYEVLCRNNNFHISMFERLIKGGLEYAQLNKQGRMRDEIAQLVRELNIYDSYETRHEVMQGKLKDLEIGCLSKSMFFYDHTRDEKQQRSSHSIYNEHEAEQVTKLAKYIVCDNNVDIGRITILCSYSGQVKCIERKLKKEDAYRLSEITVTTIDSFQGKENDIILLSLVRSSKAGKIGFLSSINRICVAVSRARVGLYLFGNKRLLAKNSGRGWKKIIDYMTRKGCIGKDLKTLLKRADMADVACSGPAAAQRSNNSSDKVININNPGVVNIGDITKITYHDEMFVLPGDGRPRQITPSSSAQEEEQSQEIEKMQSVGETSKHNPPSFTDDEGQGQLHLPFAEEREPQKNSWSGNSVQHLSAETRQDDRHLQEMGGIEEGRPVQCTYEKMKSVGETSKHNLPRLSQGSSIEKTFKDSDSYCQSFTLGVQEGFYELSQLGILLEWPPNVVTCPTQIEFREISPPFCPAPAKDNETLVSYIVKLGPSNVELQELITISLIHSGASRKDGYETIVKTFDGESCYEWKEVLTEKSRAKGCRETDHVVRVKIDKLSSLAVVGRLVKDRFEVTEKGCVVRSSVCNDVTVEFPEGAVDKTVNGSMKLQLMPDKVNIDVVAYPGPAILMDGFEDVKFNVPVIITLPHPHAMDYCSGEVHVFHLEDRNPNSNNWKDISGQIRCVEKTSHIQLHVDHFCWLWVWIYKVPLACATSLFQHLFINPPQAVCFAVFKEACEYDFDYLTMTLVCVANHKQTKVASKMRDEGYTRLALSTADKLMRPFDKAYTKVEGCYRNIREVFFLQFLKNEVCRKDLTLFREEEDQEEGNIKEDEQVARGRGKVITVKVLSFLENLEEKEEHHFCTFIIDTAKIIHREIEEEKVDSVQTVETVGLESAPPEPSDTSCQELFDFFGIVHIKCIDASTAAAKVYEKLQLNRLSMEDPPDDVVKKCRYFCQNICKMHGRLDIIKELRILLPSGITGPLKDDRVLYQQMKAKEKRDLTFSLCDQNLWQRLGDELNIPRDHLNYYDRQRNPVEELLAEVCKTRRLSVGELYDVLLKCDANALADKYL